MKGRLAADSGPLSGSLCAVEGVLWSRLCAHRGTHATSSPAFAPDWLSPRGNELSAVSNAFFLFPMFVFLSTSVCDIGTILRCLHVGSLCSSVSGVWCVSRRACQPRHVWVPLLRTLSKLFPAHFPFQFFSVSLALLLCLRPCGSSTLPMRCPLSTTGKTWCHWVPIACARCSFDFRFTFDVFHSHQR